jgi:protein TonB
VALDDASQSAALRTAEPSRPAVPVTAVAVKSAPDAAGAQDKPEVASFAEKRSRPLPLSKAALVSAASSSDEVAIVPPKLIKSVRAIASPNTLPDFTAGSSDNVTFDALVDTSGNVKSMKALRGSPSLQSAAMAALKQYRYEPATRHGKPVPAHVTVTVKFLFEP